MVSARVLTSFSSIRGGLRKFLRDLLHAQSLNVIPPSGLKSLGLGTLQTYEFLTPWLALNQQNAKKFYTLKGKVERDAFMHSILINNLGMLAKSLDYKIPEPIQCEAKIRFRIDRIERENVIVFLGKFRTNLNIPDYFGIGQSVSQGFGTIRCVPDIPVPEDDGN